MIKRMWPVVCAVFCLCAWGDAPHAIVVVEWLPSFTASNLVDALKTGLDERYPDGIRIQEMCAYGDKDEFAKLAASLNEAPPGAVVAIGDMAAKTMRTLCPGAPLLGLLIRDSAALEALDLGESPAPCVLFKADPAAARVEEAARTLCPEFKVLGIVLTADFAPNENLAAELRARGAAGEYKTVEIRVSPGYCRTESDFENAVANRYAEEPFDLLYVPDDPNASRFGDTIFRAAKAAGVPAIGTAATAGKGCQASFRLDTAFVGQEAAAVCADLLDGTAVSKAVDAAVQFQRDADAPTPPAQDPVPGENRP